MHRLRRDSAFGRLGEDQPAETMPPPR
jgi:hypothetical protein